jgi:hypothetical protein
MYEKVEDPQVIRLESPQKWGFFYFKNNIIFVV